jgi:hypothetical protein
LTKSPDRIEYSRGYSIIRRYFDLAGPKVKIDKLQADIAKQSVGDELDRDVVRLDRFRAIHTALAPATAS